jgi:hypothetical protein
VGRFLCRHTSVPGRAREIAFRAATWLHLYWDCRRHSTSASETLTHRSAPASLTALVFAESGRRSAYCCVTRRRPRAAEQRRQNNGGGVGSRFCSSIPRPARGANAAVRIPACPKRSSSVRAATPRTRTGSSPGSKIPDSCEERTIVSRINFRSLQSNPRSPVVRSQLQQPEAVLCQVNQYKVPLPKTIDLLGDSNVPIAVCGSSARSRR